MKSAAICSILLSLNPAQANRTPSFHRNRGVFHRPGWRNNSGGLSNSALVLFPRGGDDDAESALVEESATAAAAEEDESLDERVNAAMRRLGLGADDETPAESSANDEVAAEESGANCEGGVCTMEPTDDAITVEEETATTTAEPAAEEETATTTAEAAAEEDNADTAAEAAAEKDNADTAAESPAPTTQDDIYEVSERISTEMSVPTDIALAAIYSSFSGDESNPQIDEETARSIVQAEVDAMKSVPEDCDEAKQLVEEGFNLFFVRRSLAFSGMDVDNARAILNADKEDEEAEQAYLKAQQEAAEAAAREEEPEMKTVTVDYPKDFDPLAGAAAPQRPPQQQKPDGAPTPAKKEDVVFEGTMEDLQKLVIESPVPVLLDVYADWCGPCKQLTPALEQIAVNAGGMLRLVKINTDQQRQISGALEVKALPTIFGIRDGKILNSFQGMPRDQQAVNDFLMGLLVPGQNFKPPVSSEEKENYNNLSNKLLKLAAGATFSFSARERLQVHVGKLLDELVDNIGGETGMAVADDSARVLRSLMSNVIQNPFEEKFRKVKLDNKVIASKIGQHQPCLKILKSVGFAPEGDSMLVVGKGKKVVNVAPFGVARDCIDKWIDRNRYLIAAAGRKRKDEINRVRLAAEAEEAAKNHVEEEYDEESEDEVDPNLCTIKLRLEGKKKLHEIKMDAGDTLKTLLENLPFSVADEETVQFTCVAKRMIVKSTDTDKMSKTLSQMRLMPAASIVVKIGDGNKAEATKGGLAERAASREKKTSGSHSMHSIGLYAQDDGNKANTFESGGVLYEHVLSDDEDEEVESGEDERGDADDKDVVDEASEESEEEADEASEESAEEDEQ